MFGRDGDVCRAHIREHDRMVRRDDDKVMEPPLIVGMTPSDLARFTAKRIERAERDAVVSTLLGFSLTLLSVAEFGLVRRFRQATNQTKREVQIDDT